MRTTQGTIATQNILFQEPALSLGGYAVLVKEELGKLPLAFLSNHNGPICVTGHLQSTNKMTTRALPVVLNFPNAATL